ncbi:MAG: LLM class flavin-dependent oxidoreductase [Dehalococcoidia bacterium]|nr:LLM class flavin-dependent oxidoreductase [Dehalococcoidia bacterium]
MTTRSVRFTMMANPLPAPGLPTTPEQIISRAQRAEREGYDVVSYADWSRGDPFPPLMLLAQHTERVELLTRVMSASTRSPLLLASGASWVDRVSGGRFLLGLGASVPELVTGRHGLPFSKPGSRMLDTIKIVRALQGEDIPGVIRKPGGFIEYHGAVITVTQAIIEQEAIRRTPIIIAAAGPRMLQIAGAWADGVILELTTAGFIQWALENIRLGAAQTGRSLDGFEIITQPSIIQPPHDEPSRKRYDGAMTFYINHCVYPEFDRLWEVSGLLDDALRVRALAQAGQRAEAERLVVDRIWDQLVVYSGQGDTKAAFWRWFDAHVRAGVTMIGLPLEIPETVGVTVAEAKARAAQILAGAALS